MFSGFLTRTVFCSELDRTNIRLGSKNRKSLSSGLLTRTVYFSECERDTYTVRVKKQENCVSGFLTRTVYFSERERDTYTVRVKKHEKCVSGFLTRTVYFSELELADTYSSGQKTGKQNLQVFRPEPCTSASSSLQKYTVRVKKPENSTTLTRVPQDSGRAPDGESLFGVFPSEGFRISRKFTGDCSDGTCKGIVAGPTRL
jgi:hypothetical protein